MRAILSFHCLLEMLPVAEPGFFIVLLASATLRRKNLFRPRKGSCYPLRFPGLKNGSDLIDSIYMAFYKNRISVPVDLLTIDSNRYIELYNDIGYVYKTIKEEGKVIYESL